MAGLLDVAMMTLAAVGTVGAALSWVAAWKGSPRLMAVVKAVPMLALIVVVSVLASPTPVTYAVLAALVFGLFGDVALLDPPSGRAAAPYRLPLGLAAFLVGHVAYLVAIALADVVGAPYPWPALVVAPVMAAVAWRWGRPVVRGAGALATPVALYMLVIVSLAVAAATRGPAVLVVGALLFVASDLMLGRSLFVRARRWSPVAVMVTYHLAQLLLVLGLLVRPG